MAALLTLPESFFSLSLLLVTLAHYHNLALFRASTTHSHLFIFSSQDGYLPCYVTIWRYYADILFLISATHHFTYLLWRNNSTRLYGPANNLISHFHSFLSNRIFDFIYYTSAYHLIYVRIRIPFLLFSTCPFSLNKLTRFTRKLRY